ncbi:MAG TPA: sialidase family protein [Actinomycetota bacterium]|nr:sialidase family protein [Actinomycetota bacterium]
MPDGEVSNWKIPTGGDAAFSAYGPLVVLPSGTLMQTIYGWGKGYYRIWGIYSFDDGYRWNYGREIWRTSVAMPNETAAAYVDGRTDWTSRLIAVHRSARRVDGRWFGYIMQSVSTDGGRTWRQAGVIGKETRRGVIPWIANIGKGRLALLTAVRDHDDLSINVSIAPAWKVVSNPRAWPEPRTIYRSRLMDTERIKIGSIEQSKNFGDFGYQSIVRTGPTDADLFVVLMDSHNGHSGFKPDDYPSNTELVMIPLFGETL